MATLLQSGERKEGKERALLCLGKAVLVQAPLRPPDRDVRGGDTPCRVQRVQRPAVGNTVCSKLHKLPSHCSKSKAEYAHGWRQRGYSS